MTAVLALGLNIVVGSILYALGTAVIMIFTIGNLVFNVFMNRKVRKQLLINCDHANEFLREQNQTTWEPLACQLHIRLQESATENDGRNHNAFLVNVDLVLDVYERTEAVAPPQPQQQHPIYPNDGPTYYQSQLPQEKQAPVNQQGYQSLS